MIELIDKNNIEASAEAFSASWRFSHNGIVSEEELDEHHPERMKQIIAEETKKGNVVYTYMQDDNSLGIISFDLSHNHISKLYVNPAYLRCGIGKQLVLFAIDKMDKEKDVSVYSLNVNFRARRFYESLGFSFNGEEKKFGDSSFLCLCVYIYKR